MSTDATKRDALYRLVDQLPRSELHAALRFLEYLVREARTADAGTVEESAAIARTRPEDDPVLRAFTYAPEIDESLTAEDIAAIEEGKADIARGDLVPWEEAKARLFGRA